MVDQNKKIQEMQILEQNLQNLLMQKQAFQLEVSETTAALAELEKSGEEVYKIIGQLMVKTEKEDVKKELEGKKKILDLRNKTISKQEEALTEQLEKVREELMEASK